MELARKEGAPGRPAGRSASQRLGSRRILRTPPSSFSVSRLRHVRTSLGSKMAGKLIRQVCGAAWRAYRPTKPQRHERTTLLVSDKLWPAGPYLCRG